MDENQALASSVRNYQKRDGFVALSKRFKGKAKEGQCAGVLQRSNGASNSGDENLDSMAEEAGRTLPPISP